MSYKPIANRRRRATPKFVHFVAVVFLAAFGFHLADANSAGQARPALETSPSSGEPLAPGREPVAPIIAQVTPAPDAGASPPFDTIIVTVSVNGVSRGTAPILRDGNGRIFVPELDYRTWGLAVPAGAEVRLQGIAHVNLSRVPDMQVHFDEKRIALEITVEAKQLPKNTIDLHWRYPDALRPTERSAFFNYAVTVSGDQSFNSSRTRITTEAGGRMGDALLYSSGTYADGGIDKGYTRLQTNLTYDQRDSLQRLIVGDFFTPVRELSNSFPMGGVSFSKYYPMDPYFIQYPTLSLSTTAALPSQVEVRIDGNVIARQQVQPGPVDIVNVTGYTGARNVQVVVRDAFGREQVIQQPYYFTDFALRKGLQDYSYNLGFIREKYGVESNDYEKPAFSGFHRYGFSDTFTLGLRGEAREGMLNAGPIATILLPGAGIVGAGVSASGGDGGTGFAGSLFYSFVAPRYSISANARHFSNDYRMLPFGTPSVTRNFATGSVAYSLAQQSTISASYTVTEQFNLETLRSWNVGYNVSLFGSRGILTLGYTKNEGLVNDWSGSITFRYLFSGDYSAVASLVRAGSVKSQAFSIDKTVPVGEGYGFSVGPGHLESPLGSTTLANAFGQYNGRYASLMARYVGSSNDRVDRGVAEISFASGFGYVPGRFFVSRPLTDSFAVVKVADVPNVAVTANGQLMGTTDERGEVVVSPMISFYDNYIGFDQRAVPLDYIYKRPQMVVSPALRSGSYLKFDVKKQRAVLGRLEREVDGRRVPIEFRELKVMRAGVDKATWEAQYGQRYFVQSFTAKGGEFYIEQLEPGEWTLQVEGDSACVATIQVFKTEEALTDLGAVLCAPPKRERATKKP